jgi:hypothetical protein
LLDLLTDTLERLFEIGKVDVRSQIGATRVVKDVYDLVSSEGLLSEHVSSKSTEIEEKEPSTDPERIVKGLFVTIVDDQSDPTNALQFACIGRSPLSPLLVDHLALD